MNDGARAVSHGPSRRRGSPREALADELVNELHTLDPAGERAIARAVPVLAEMLSLDLAAGHRILRNLARTGHEVEFFIEHGPTIRSRFMDHLSNPTGPVALYDPLCPEPDQRNRVLVHPWTRFGHMMESTLGPAGLRGSYQVRALLCDGPVLLAWFGGFRHERPRRDEVTAFHRLLEPLRRRLALERRLGESELWRSGLAAALDALAVPGFLVTSTGVVKHANALGTRWLEDHHAGVRAAIRDALKGDAREFQATPVALRGAPAHVLLVAQANGDVQLGARVQAARVAWALTQRQVDVLERLALGDANKDIARRFAMSLRTVEQHVRNLTAKARVESRLQLVARLWSSR